MKLTRREHPNSGEPCYQAMEWSPPPHYKPREKLGIQGHPFLVAFVLAARVELCQGWCFSSGHMESYEEEPEMIIERAPDGWPSHLHPALAERFGEEIAAEIEAVLADPMAFSGG